MHILTQIDIGTGKGQKNTYILQNIISDDS